MKLPSKLLQQTLKDQILVNNYHRGQRLAAHQTHRLKIIEGGNRTGKTEFGAKETVAHALGFRPWLHPDHTDYRLPYVPPLKIRIGAENLSKSVVETIIPKLMKYLPQSQIAATRVEPKTGAIVYIRLLNGSEIFVITYTMDPDDLEGSDFDFAWFDEPPPRSIFMATWRGLTDRLGSALITCTLLKEPWIHQELYARAVIVDELYGKENSPEQHDQRLENRQGDKDNYAARWDITVNLGYGLTQEKIDGLASKLKPEERLSRLHGKPAHYHGLVFKDFDRAYHVMEGDLDDTEAYTYYESVDPHERTPHAYSFYAVGEDGTVYKYDELWYEQGVNACSAKELAAYVLAKRKGIPVWIKADPWVFRQPNEETCFADKVEEASKGLIRFERGSKQRAAATMAIHEALRLRQKRAQYIVLAKCQRTIWEYENWIYHEFRGVTADQKDKSGKGIDKDDHMIETDGRAFLGNMVYDPDYAYIGKTRLERYEEDEGIVSAGSSSRNPITGC